MPYKDGGRRWRAEHPNYMRDWHKAHPNYLSPAETPERARAYSRLWKALRDGEVDRTACEMCGSSERVQGHHAFGYDGEMATAVWWLCHTHHAAMHAAIRQNQ